MKISVIGGGPAGLSFAVCAAEQAELLGISPEDLSITVYEIRLDVSDDREPGRWCTTPDMSFRSVNNRRREQVATLQRGTQQLFDVMTEGTQSAFRGDPVWPNSENVGLCDVDDRLLQRMHSVDVKKYAVISQLPPKVAAAIASRAPRAYSPLLREWLEGLECDILVGADGANSTVRAHFEELFQTKRLAERKDYTVGVGFDELPGWEPQSPALSALISYSQNRYWLQTMNGGRRGFMHMRLSEKEFNELTASATSLDSFANPCVVFNLLAPRPSDNVPLWQGSARLQSAIEEGLRLFDVSASVVTTMVGLEIDPHYAACFHAKAASKELFLIGDAAMAPHFWTGKSLDSALRGSMALCHTLLSTCKGGSAQEHAQHFEAFMQDMKAEELDRRSSAMLSTDGRPPALPMCTDSMDTSDARKASREWDKLAAEMAGRIKAWRDRLQADGTGNVWLHSKLPDRFVDDRFSPALRPQLSTLRVMCGSALHDEDQGLWGAPLTAFLSAGHPLPVPVRAGARATPREMPECIIADHEEATARRGRATDLREVRVAKLWKEIREVEEQQAMASTALRRADDLEAEEVRGESHDDFYDIVLTVDNFRDLLRDGWRLQEKPELGDAEELSASTRIVILGNFKKGKTWLMTKLTGSALPCSEVVHTPGLCSKKIFVDGKPCYILDVKGENSPLAKMDKDWLMDKKAEESFLREIICDISDTFIYLVQSVGYTEQVTLFQLCDQLKAYNKASSMVLVVHNLRHLTRISDLRAAEEEICELYREQGLKRQMRMILNPVTNQKEEVWFLEGDQELNPESNVNKFQARHFVLAAEGSEAGHKNSLVIERLKGTILDSSLTKKQPLKAEILSAVQKRVSSYLVGKPATRTDFVDDRLVCHAESGEELQLREQDLGNFVSVKAHTLTPVPYRVSETGTHVRVQIILPGLAEDQISQVIKLTRTIDGVKVQVKTDKKWRRLAADEHLIDGTLPTDSVDFVINVRRMLKSKIPTKKELKDGTYTLEWEIDVDDIEL